MSAAPSTTITRSSEHRPAGFGPYIETGPGFATLKDGVAHCVMCRKPWPCGGGDSPDEAPEKQTLSVSPPEASMHQPLAERTVCLTCGHLHRRTLKQCACCNADRLAK